MVRCTDRPDMTIAVNWDVKKQTKQTKHGRITAMVGDIGWESLQIVNEHDQEMPQSHTPYQPTAP